MCQNVKKMSSCQKDDKLSKRRHCTPIIDLSCHKWTIYISAPKQPITQMAIAQRATKGKKMSSLSYLTHIDTFMAIYGSKFQIPIRLESVELFNMSKSVKNCHLMAHQMANRAHIQKSKPGYVEHPWPHLWTDS